MKRFMYLLMFTTYLAFMAASCGLKSEKSNDHGHDHGTETHEPDNEHDHEHAGQEEFVVGDSTDTSTTDEHHDHDQSDGHIH